MISRSIYESIQTLLWHVLGEDLWFKTVQKVKEGPYDMPDEPKPEGETSELCVSIAQFPQTIWGGGGGGGGGEIGKFSIGFGKVLNIQYAPLSNRRIWECARYSI